MSELSVELDKDERRAMKNGSRAFIDATGDVITIVGPAAVIRQAVALGLCPYVEFDGFVRASLPDPIPNRGRVAVNALMKKLWRHPK